MIDTVYKEYQYYGRVVYYICSCRLLNVSEVWPRYIVPLLYCEENNFFERMIEKRKDLKPE